VRGGRRRQRRWEIEQKNRAMEDRREREEEGGVLQQLLCRQRKTLDMIMCYAGKGRHLI